MKRTNLVVDEHLLVQATKVLAALWIRNLGGRSLPNAGRPAAAAPPRVILVDTSIWIEPLARKPRRAIREEGLLRFATCGPIVQEVPQGLKPGLQSDAFRAAFLAIPVFGDPIPLRLFVSAAEIYRQGRRRGITIRSSVDCLIAAIAIDHRVPVWHRDRDFSAMARYSGLEAVPSISASRP